MKKKMRKIAHFLILKKIKKRMIPKIHQSESKIRKIKTFFKNLVRKNYFEMGILALKWNTSYIENYALKGPSVEMAEAMHQYSLILNFYYPNLQIKMCSKARQKKLKKMYDSKHPNRLTTRSAFETLHTTHTEDRGIASTLRDHRENDERKEERLMKMGNEDGLPVMVDSLFKVFNAKLVIMAKIRKRKGYLICEQFKFRRPTSKLEFWKRLYTELIQAVLPISKHGIFFDFVNIFFRGNFC